MWIPVQRLRCSALKPLRLEIVDFDRIHAAILEQLETLVRTSQHLHRLHARAAQDVDIRRAIVAVIAEGERIRTRGGEKEADRGEQTERKQGQRSQSFHRRTSLHLGSTDKFSTAILVHLFCPHFVGKSST